MAHTCNPSTLEAEAGVSDQGHPQPPSEFKVSQGFLQYCLRKSKEQRKKNLKSSSYRYLGI